MRVVTEVLQFWGSPHLEYDAFSIDWMGLDISPFFLQSCRVTKCSSLGGTTLVSATVTPSGGTSGITVAARSIQTLRQTVRHPKLGASAFTDGDCQKSLSSRGISNDCESRLHSEVPLYR